MTAAPIFTVPRADAETAAPRTVCVLGGGIAGLTAAYRLVQQGFKVTLFEGTDQLGGLGTFFGYQGRTFEKFYHCMLPSDAPLLALLEDLGLAQDVYWKATSFGYAGASGQIHRLNTPLDLLKFAPLPFVDRLRVGFTGLMGRLGDSKGLDDITAAAWLSRLSGPRAFETFWKPMLMAKFGDFWAEVPALWFWTRFNREKGDSSGETKGYLRGGYQRIVETLQNRIQRRGGTIFMETPVQSLEMTPAGDIQVVSPRGVENFSQCVITLPWVSVQRIIGPNLVSQMLPHEPEIDYVGVINTVLFLNRSLTPHYWVATPQDQYPFDGVIETSTLTESEDRGARHVVYLTKYLHRSDPRFSENEASIGQSWFSALQQLFPDLQRQQVEAAHVFKAPFVEPIYTCGFLHKRPAEEIVPGKVFLATTTQVYPTVTSWNGSIGQVNRTLLEMGVTAV
jgi:protoporphyrinogen oxidase